MILFLYSFPVKLLFFDVFYFPSLFVENKSVNFFINLIFSSFSWICVRWIQQQQLIGSPLLVS
jgi:hypothetical protein